MTDKSVPVAKAIYWNKIDIAILMELVEKTPLEMTGSSLKSVLDNPDVTSKIVQRE